MSAATYRVHERLPSGFTYANQLQIEAFEQSGSVDGAAKICMIADAGELPRLAFRARPPRALSHIRSNLGRGSASTVEEYIAEYNAGWKASRTGADSKWQDGSSSHAYDDGFMDYAVGRAKWHLTYCANHDECGEG